MAGVQGCGPVGPPLLHPSSKRWVVPIASRVRLRPRPHPFGARPLGCAPHAASGRALDPLSTRSGGRGWVQGGTLPNVRNFGEAEILRKCALCHLLRLRDVPGRTPKGQGRRQRSASFPSPGTEEGALSCFCLRTETARRPDGPQRHKGALMQTRPVGGLRCALRAKATAGAEGERPPSEADVYSLRFPLESCSPAPSGRVNPRACRPSETGGIGLRPSAS